MTEIICWYCQNPTTETKAEYVMGELMCPTCRMGDYD